MTNLVISNQAISQHNGLFSLNDLHKVSGGADKHRPTWFLRNQETKELIAEIESENQIAYMTVQGGNTKTTKQGTYVCRELVYRYAMWISAKFSLMVIRAFDGLNTGAIPCLDKQCLSDFQAFQLQKAVKAKCRHNRSHYQTLYRRLYDEFGVKSYKDIMAHDFGRAMVIVEQFNPNPNPINNIDPKLLYKTLADSAVYLREYANVFGTLERFGYCHHVYAGQQKPSYEISDCFCNIVKVAESLGLVNEHGTPMFADNKINFYHGSALYL